MRPLQLYGTAKPPQFTVGAMAINQPVPSEYTIIVRADRTQTFQAAATIRSVCSAAGITDSGSFCEKEKTGDESFRSTRAVVRRLSRETAQLSSEIERDARWLLASLSNRNTKRLVLMDAELADAYSIRVLASLHRLNRGPLTVEVFFGADFATNLSNFSPTRLAREQLLRRFLEMGMPYRTTSASEVGPADALPNNRIDQTSEDLPDQIATAIEELAYDKASYLIEIATVHAETSNELAELRLLSAMILSNIGDTAGAFELIIGSLHLGACPKTTSRLRYCAGLIMAKRLNRLDDAQRQFEAGIECVKKAESFPTARVELAWHTNGLALLDSLRASKAKGTERHGHLRRALARETGALRMIGGDEGQDGSYLRYNLIANCTFVYEMLGQSETAATLFQQVFGAGYQQAINSPARFRLNYGYRMGVLLMKAGRTNDSVAHLRRALRSAIDLSDQHQETRVRLALAVVLRTEGLFQTSAEEMTAGALLAEARLDKEMMHAFSQIGEAAEFRLASKLPAYIPMVDLLDTPGASVNMALSSTDSGQPHASSAS